MKYMFLVGWKNINKTMKQVVTNFVIVSLLFSSCSVNFVQPIPCVVPLVLNANLLAVMEQPLPNRKVQPGESVANGSSVIASCGLGGFLFVGTNQATCINGLFDRQFGTCMMMARNCQIPMLDNGRYVSGRSYEISEISSGETIWPQCDYGFTMTHKGTNTARTCIDGTLTGFQVECLTDYLQKRPIPPGKLYWYHYNQNYQDRKFSYLFKVINHFFFPFSSASLPSKILFSMMIIFIFVAISSILLLYVW